MKKRGIFLILLVLFMPLAFGKQVTVSDVSDGEIVAATIPDSTYYALLEGTVVAAVGDEEASYFHSDRLGSNVRSINGGIKKSKTLPFGQNLQNNGIKFTFTGKEMDDSGLYYYGARYYDSDLGRFISTDPVMDELSYVYVENNPLRFIDPTGMNWEIAYEAQQHPEDYEGREGVLFNRDVRFDDPSAEAGRVIVEGSVIGLGVLSALTAGTGAYLGLEVLALRASVAIATGTGPLSAIGRRLLGMQNPSVPTSTEGIPGSTTGGVESAATPSYDIALANREDVTKWMWDMEGCAKPATPCGNGYCFERAMHAGEREFTASVSGDNLLRIMAENAKEHSLKVARSCHEDGTCPFEWNELMNILDGVRRVYAEGKNIE